MRLCLTSGVTRAIIKNIFLTFHQLFLYFFSIAVSPSIACYGESASTLRWASRAKQLRTPTQLQKFSIQKTQAALHAQLQQIISELTKYHIEYVSIKNQGVVCLLEY